MVEFTRQAAGALMLAYDFSGVGTIVDLGGGHGALLPPILRSHPEITATVADVPACRAGAERTFEKTRIADRCTFRSLDLAREDPPPADLYLLKNVLHGCDDAGALTILRRCRAAMDPGSRLLVLESLRPERASAADAGTFGSDLRMLLATGGRERTESEYRELLATAGLRLERTLPTLAGIAVLEAVPAA